MSPVREARPCVCARVTPGAGVSVCQLRMPGGDVYGTPGLAMFRDILRMSQYRVWEMRQIPLYRVFARAHKKCRMCPADRHWVLGLMDAVVICEY
ncbi:hypothetical protein GDO81_022875 [Engystomops pustulosus]|uniref:Uncharacterized protein n=1 Tax=Engystomops pustulosus TaxID=76066 RepID=A0AAV6ZA82_ENGPU|nr:hypothetical protein GDO81_022875 [Engystomops pustulosus]